MFSRPTWKRSSSDRLAGSPCRDRARRCTRRHGYLPVLLALCLFTAPSLPAQSGPALLFSTHLPQRIVNPPGGGGFAQLDCQEIGLVRSGTAGATAVKLLSLQTLHAYQGDPDQLGDYTSPFVTGTMDALFVPLAEQGRSAHPRLPFVSVSRRSMPLFRGGRPHLLDHAALFRWRPGGDTQVLLTRSHLQAATGIQTASLDLDAFCQDHAGNIYFSLALDEPAGQPVIRDGDLCILPATALTRDGAGMVKAVKAGSASVIADEARLDLWTAASGLADPAGRPVGKVGNLGALALDPGGGTFTPAAGPGPNCPNLLFAGSGASWSLGICSTAGGGTIARVAGMTLGSTLKTTGAHLGLGGQGGGAATSGLGGLALCALPGPEILLREDQGGRFLQTTGKVVFRFAGAEPGRTVLALVSPGPNLPGRYLPSFPLVGLPLAGNQEFFLDPSFLLLLDLGRADGTGAGGLTLPLPPGYAGPALLVVQALGPVGGTTLSLSPPILVQWF